MSTTHLGGLPAPQPPDPLIVHWVYLVDVCSFTFQFISLDQLRECLRYFREPLHRTSRLPDVTLEHYWQRWFERIPQRLLQGAKRRKVVAALERALADFERPE